MSTIKRLLLKRKKSSLLDKCLYHFKLAYYHVTDFFTIYFERTSRAIAFARFSWTNYDFDFSSIWSLLSFKLKRLNKALKNGIAEHDKEDLKALSEAITICDRLYKENYEEKYLKAHDIKYGKLKTKLISSDNGSREWKTSRKNVNKRNKKQERKDFLTCFENAEKDRQKDLNRLNEILIKHSPKWWD